MERQRPTSASRSSLPLNSRTLSGFASVIGLCGTAAHPLVLTIEMGYVPMRSAIAMISVLSRPISGLRIGTSRPCCSARMFVSVCDATWPMESPMTTPEAPIFFAKRAATECITLLHMTHW